MDIERVGPSGSTSPSEKKGRKSTPDSEEFREMLRTGKVGEPEFEKRKKRKFQEEEESRQLPAPSEKKPASPTSFKSRPKINTPQGEGQKPTKQLAKETKTGTTQQDEDKEKKPQEKKKKGLKTALYEEQEKKTGKTPTEEEEMLIAKKEEKEEFLKKEVPKPPKEKKEEFSVIKEEKPVIEEGKRKEKEEFKHEISSVLQEMPHNIASQTQSLTSNLTPYLHPDIVPLFEKMVGTIIHIQAQGITTTQVILNSPAFTSSIFFGSSIVLEKYSTAPDSFNIFLRGPQQAVVMFNDNLEGLIDAFRKANFNFKIGRLEAEHERPLIRRKDEKNEKDGDSKK